MAINKHLPLAHRGCNFFLQRRFAPPTTVEVFVRADQSGRKLVSGPLLLFESVTANFLSEKKTQLQFFMFCLLQASFRSGIRTRDLS